MGNGLVPFRRNIAFAPARDAPIEPLLEHLSFIKVKRRWGYPFRRGYFEIPERDFKTSAKAMGADT